MLTLTRVATAPVLVAEIAQATGRHLEVSPAMRSEVLMVSVKGAQTRDVLTRLALAATAVWQPLENGYRLVPDNAARGIEAIAERARRLQAIQEGLKKKKEAPQGATPRFDGFMGGGSVDAFIPMLDLSSIAALESGDRIVFATDPTAAQRPLRGDVSGVVSAWILQHNKSAIGMSEGMSQMPENLAAIMQGPLGERFKRMSNPVSGKPAKVVVVASRGSIPFMGGLGLGVQIQARVYDASGAVMLEKSGSLDSKIASLIMARMASKPPSAAKETTITYSEDAKALSNLSNSGGINFGGGAVNFGVTGAPPAANAAILKRLSRPDEFEPLALVPGEGLAALATSRRKPLVACIPDAAYPTTFGSRVPKTVEELEEDLKAGPMRIVPDAQYLVLRPAEPATARRNRVDRTALASIARASADHESPTLDEVADFASRTPDPSLNPLSTAYLTIFAPSGLASSSGIVSWSGLRLYAALSPAHRKSLAEGAQIPFSVIGPGAKEALRTLLYGASGGVELDGQGSESGDMFSMGMKMVMGGTSSSAREEPTQIVPWGIPVSGYLQASVSSEPILRPIKDGSGAASVLSLDEIAIARLFRSSPMGEEMGDAMKMPETGRLGSRSIWSIRGYVAPGTYVSTRLNDDRTPKDGARVALSDLPADVQKQVAQREANLKKGPMGAILSMGSAKP